MLLETCGMREYVDVACWRKESERIFTAWLFFQICSLALCGYIEIVEQQGCHDNEYRLTCPALDTHLAILEAFFTPLNSTVLSSAATGDQLSNSTTCGIRPFLFSYPHTSSHRFNVSRRILAENKSYERNIRMPLIYRCSGVNHCNFILNLDHEESETWGPGIVYIKYACMDVDHLTRYCNQEVLAGEGFIQTPGYPHYYVGERTCRWLIRAPKGQTIRVTLLDLSLRSIGPFDHDCVDHISISDPWTEQLLLSSCDQVEEPTIFDSVGETLDVLVRMRSKNVYPKRGILFHYKAMGCVTPAAPLDGYFVYRDGARAHYMCCVGHAFPDTRQRERTLHCQRDNTWGSTLPDCIKITTEVWNGNGTFVVEHTPQNSDNSETAKMIVDIVIPSIIIAALLIGNAFIVLIIFKYRKRKDLELAESDEFNFLREDVALKNGTTSKEGLEGKDDGINTDAV